MVQEIKSLRSDMRSKAKLLTEQRERTFGARNQEVGEVKGLRNPDSTVLLFITLDITN